MRKFVVIAVSIVGIVVIGLVGFNMLTQEKYASDDILFGSYTIDGQDYSDYPAHYIVSIDVPDDNDALKSAAERSGVDISKGSWLYSFEEDKVYRAKKKDDHELVIYDGDSVVGKLKCTSKRFLWKEYDVNYQMEWESEKFDITKTLQGFVYP